MKTSLIFLVAFVASGIAANIDGPDSAIKELDDLNQELDDFILEGDDEEGDEFDEEDEEQSSLVRALPFLRAPTCDGKIKTSCSQNYGYCVTKPFKSNCKDGTLKKGCKGKNCQCCIPDKAWCKAKWPTLENGKVTMYGFKILDIMIGDVIDFKCQKGYGLVGATEATCLLQGEWSNELPHCEPSTNPTPQPPTPTVTQVVPDNRLLPFIRIRDEHIQWSQGSFYSLGEAKEQNYTLVLAQGPGTEKEFVYIQNSYPQDDLIDVCDLTYGSYMIDDNRKGFFFVYHDRLTQNPEQKFFGLKANGVDQAILDAINESPDADSSSFPGTTSSSFWNFNWLYGDDFLLYVRC